MASKLARERDMPDRDDRLPAEFPRNVAESWYLTRLGVLDEPLRAEFEKALSRYLATFVPDPAPPCWKWQEKLITGDDGETRKKWSPSHIGVYPPQIYNKTLRKMVSTQPIRLNRRLVLGQFWRGKLARHVGNIEDTKILLGTEAAMRRLYLHKHRNDSVLTELFAAGRHVDPMKDGHKLNLPASEHWLWVGPGPVGIGYVVIDLDCKTDADVPAFEAALRLLTEVVLAPRPHFIVTSKSTRGRHLYYLVDSPTRRARPSAHVDRLRSAIESKFGFTFKAGVIEAFPKGPDQPVPYLPFGPNSWLCDAAGAVIDKDPVGSLLRWSDLIANAPSPYSVEQLMRIKSKPFASRLVTSIRAAVKRRDSAEKRAAARPVVVTASSEQSRAADDNTKPLARKSSSTSPYDVEWANEFMAHGFVRGDVDGPLPHIIAYLKHNLRMTQEQGEEVLLGLLDPLIDNGEHSKDHYLSRIRPLWKKRQFALRSGPLRFVIGDRDVVWVVKQVAEWTHLKPTRRKASVRLWLAVIGLARAAGVGRPGFSKPVPLASEKLFEWFGDDYRKLRESLVHRHLVRLVVESSRAERRAARYEVRLPPAVSTLVLPTVKAIWPHVVTVLNDDLGERLVGEKNWAYARAHAAEGP